VSATRNLALVLTLVALALLAYWPSTAAWWRFWELNQYVGGQGPLIAAISLGLIVRSRRALSAAPLRAFPAAIAGLLACSVAWVIGWRAAIQELHLLLLPLILILATLAAFGRTIARIVAFPLGYLYFAEPSWHLLIGPLQQLTLRIAGGIVPILGMPVTIAGNVLYFSHDVSFEVTPLCSGLNFLVVGLAVAALIGELQHASLRRRLALLASMALLMVVSNWIRVLVIIVAGYTSGMRNVLATSGHVILGWILFALVMLGYALVVGHRPVPTAPAPREASPAGGPWLTGFTITTVLLITVPMLARGASNALPHRTAVPALHLPSAQPAWSGPFASGDLPWRPEFIGAHSEWHVAYRDAQGAIVELLAIGYESQGQDHKLVSERNSLLGTGDLTAVAVSSVGVGKPPHIETLASDPQGRQFLVWSIYDVGGRRFSTPLFAQLWYGVSSLAGSPYSALFAYRTSCEPSCEAARMRLAAFAQNVGREVVVTPGTS